VRYLLDKNFLFRKSVRLLTFKTVGCGSLTFTTVDAHLGSNMLMQNMHELAISGFVLTDTRL